MIQTVNLYVFHEAFHTMGRASQFSVEARNALFEYFEDFEEDTGEAVELDVIAICCEWSEDELANVLDNYGIEIDGDDFEEDGGLDVLRNSTYAIELDNGNILYQDF